MKYHIKVVQKLRLMFFFYLIIIKLTTYNEKKTVLVNKLKNEKNPILNEKFIWKPYVRVVQKTLNNF